MKSNQSLQHVMRLRSAIEDYLSVEDRTCLGMPHLLLWRHVDEPALQNDIASTPESTGELSGWTEEELRFELDFLVRHIQNHARAWFEDSAAADKNLEAFTANKKRAAA